MLLMQKVGWDSRLIVLPLRILQHCYYYSGYYNKGKERSGSLILTDKSMNYKLWSYPSQQYTVPEHGQRAAAEGRSQHSSNMIWSVGVMLHKPRCTVCKKHDT